MEAAGIPTTALANLPKPVERVRYPRAALVKFPRGATVGPPGAPDIQRDVIRAALGLLESATVPGTVVELPHRFGEAV